MGGSGEIGKFEGFVTQRRSQCRGEAGSGSAKNAHLNFGKGMNSLESGSCCRAGRSRCGQLGLIVCAVGCTDGQAGNGGVRWIVSTFDPACLILRDTGRTAAHSSLGDAGREL